MAGDIATAPIDTSGLIGPPPALPSSASTSAAVTGPPSALPSLNPADSPYTPLSLPEVPQPNQHPLPEQQPVQNLGAVSKAGAAAYLVDQVLRGAVQGYDAHQQRKADQANKKLKALNDLQNSLGQQYVQTYNEVGSSQPGMTADQINNDPKVKALRNQLLAVHQATLGAVQGYIGDGSGGGGSSKKGKKGGPDNQLQTYYQAASQLGPPAFYQVASPQQLAAMYQQRQGQGAQQQATTATAQATATRAQVEADLAAAESSPVPTDPAAAKARQDKIDRLRQTAQDLVEAASPYHRPTESELKRGDYDILLGQGKIPVDPKTGQTMTPEVWIPYQAAAGRAAGSPEKPLHYDNNTGTISDPNTGKTYAPNDLNLPLDVAKVFAAANDQAFKKQQRALQQIEERGNAYLMGRVVQVPQPDGTVIYERAITAIQNGDPTPSSIWFKLQMPTGTERARADLAISAREQLNTMAGILTSRKDLFGPAAGKGTDFTTWIGSQDPDAQRFAAAARIAADHLAGVFGGRSQEALNKIYELAGQFKTNPQAAIAGLEQLNIAAAAIQARGGGLPGAATPPASTPAPAAPSVLMRAPNGQTKSVPANQVEHYKAKGAVVAAQPTATPAPTAGGGQ